MGLSVNEMDLGCFVLELLLCWKFVMPQAREKWAKANIDIDLRAVQTLPIKSQSTSSATVSILGRLGRTLGPALRPVQSMIYRSWQWTANWGARHHP